MYKIIGVDQSEYGPVTADQVRQWIAEGRVNAQTLAQAEGETGWRPVSSFPEFAPSLTRPPVASLPGAGAAVSDEAGRARALQMVAGPAIGLIIVGALGIFLSLLSVVMNLANSGENPLLNGAAGNPQVAQILQTFSGTVGILADVVEGLAWVGVLLGALKLRNLKNFGFCMAASIIAMIPCLCPCCVAGLPIGIWALVVMNKPEVKPFFT